MNARRPKAKLMRGKQQAISSRHLCSEPERSETRLPDCAFDRNAEYDFVPRTRTERIALCFSCGLYLSLFAQGTLETPQDLFYMLALVAYCAVLTYWIPARALSVITRERKPSRFNHPKP